MRERKIKAAFLDLLYPPRCPICDEVLDVRRRRMLSGAGAVRAGKRMPQGSSGERKIPGVLALPQARCCPSCAGTLPWIREPACMKCGGPLGDESREYCEDCRRHPHSYDRGVAAFTYTGALRHSVYRLKSSNRRDYVPFFAEAMAGALARHLPNWRPEAIIPVPMHPGKRRLRGYNQSELLALEIGRLTGIPVEKDLLYCTRMVRPQKTLNRQERLRNLRGCFAVRGGSPAFKRVLVADDVYTTGSTMDEIGRVLRKAGVQEIYFAVLCTGKGKKTVCTAEKV